MKKIILLLFIIAANCAAAQKNDYVISMKGLGALQLGMSQNEVEKGYNQQ